MSTIDSSQVRKPSWLMEKLYCIIAMLLIMAIIMPGVVVMSTVIVCLWRGLRGDAAAVSSAPYVQMILSRVILWLSGAAEVSGDTTFLWVLGILLIVVVLAIFVAIVLSGYPTADHIVPSSFDEMEQRQSQVRAALAHVDANPLLPGSPSADAAYQEAKTHMTCIEHALDQKGLPWVLGTGYIHIWNCLYRAEEALIEVQPAAEVIAGAIRDESRLEGSNIDHCNGLLDQLRQAVAVIDPSAQKYLLKAAAAPVAPPLVITSPAALSDGFTGVSWSASLAASGGKPPYHWTPSAGSLPPWLTLSPAGTLGGTPPATGTCHFAARVTDSAGVTATQAFTLTVRTLEITTQAPLSEATVGEASAETLVAAGGTAAANWAIRAGALPSGLALNVVESNGQQVTQDCTVIVTSPVTSVGPTDGIADPKIVARAVLHTVRNTINDFRAERWHALVVARNRMAGTMMLTGCLAYMLLIIAILGGVTQSNLTAASAFYLVGAITGLLSRLYSESQTATGVEDYGLSAMRLLSMPLISGLVAIIGVVLVALVPLSLPDVTQIPDVAQTRSPQSLLKALFDLDKNLYGLFWAAIFGLTPSLLFNRLQQLTERYKADLQSSEATHTSK